jgi:hypothetical protein
VARFDELEPDGRPEGMERLARVDDIRQRIHEKKYDTESKLLEAFRGLLRDLEKTKSEDG